MKTTVAPFLRPPVSAVIHSGWTLRGPAGETPLPVDLGHWDYQTILSMSSSVSVDLGAVLDSSHLTVPTKLALVVTVRSDLTNVQRCVQRIELPEQTWWDATLDVTLPGADLGGRLDIETFLVAVDPHPASSLAARRKGSILWRTRHTTHLDGHGARFPTDAADFSASRPALADATWHLHIDTSDSEASFMSCVRLTLNTSHQAIRDLLDGAAGPEVTLLRRTIRWDVTRQLVVAALRLEDIDDTPSDPDATSLAGVLRNILASVWRHDDPSSIRRRWETDTELIELQIQQHVRLLVT